MAGGHKATMTILRHMQTQFGTSSPFAGANLSTINNMSRTGRRYMRTITPSPKPAPGKSRHTHMSANF